MKWLMLFLMMLVCTAALAQNQPDPAVQEPPPAKAAGQMENEPSLAEFTGQEPPPAEAASQAEAKPVEPEPVAVPDPIAGAAATGRPPLDSTPDAPVPPAPAQEGKPTLAIYMAGEEPKGVRGVHNVLGGELARTISESEKYLAVDRTSDILKQIEREHVYQRSGAVNDEQIKSLGLQLGVQYLCIAQISAVAERSYYVDARLIDVVTAEIIRTVTANSSLRDAGEMTRVAQSVAYELIETEKAKERMKQEEIKRERKKKTLLYTAICLDAAGAGLFAYGLMENSNIKTLNGKGKYPSAQKAEGKRNIAYMLGGMFLAAGVSIHIFF